MEINFVNDDKLRNLELLYAAFEYPQDETIDMPRLKVGPLFSINTLKSKLLNKRTSVLIFKKALKGEMNRSKFLIWLNQLLEAMPNPADDAKEAVEFESEIKASVKENYAVLRGFFNSVYGFGVPKSITVLLSNSNKTKSGIAGEVSSMLVDAPPLVCLNMNAIRQEKMIPLINLVHELLHAMIYKKKLFDYRVAGTSTFEELLIRYTTESMLVNRLKLSKHVSINECYNGIVSQLNGSKTTALKMKHLMESYDKEYGKRTIWAAISETGFKRSFGMPPPGTERR